MHVQQAEPGPQWCHLGTEKLYGLRHGWSGGTKVQSNTQRPMDRWLSAIRMKSLQSEPLIHWAKETPSFPWSGSSGCAFQDLEVSPDSELCSHPTRWNMVKQWWQRAMSIASEWHQWVAPNHQWMVLSLEMDAFDNCPVEAYRQGAWGLWPQEHPQDDKDDVCREK